MLSPSLLYPIWFVAFFSFAGLAIYNHNNKKWRTAFVIILVFGFVVGFLFSGTFSDQGLPPGDPDSLTAIPFTGWVHYETKVTNPQFTYDQIVVVDDSGHEYLLDPHAVHPHIHSVGPYGRVQTEFEKSTDTGDKIAEYYIENAEKHRQRIIHDDYTIKSRVNNELRRHQEIRWNKEYLQDSSEITTVRYYVVTAELPDDRRQTSNIKADPISEQIKDRQLVYEYP